MAQAVIGKELANAITDENYYYIGVKASPFAKDSVVFGLKDNEVLALAKRFQSSDYIKTVENGVIIQGAPFSVINALAELGYRVISSTGGGTSDTLWTMQREL
ncbi:uncharacterized protein LOC144477207 [Augochlora pura]